MLAHRLWRWSNNKIELVQCFVLKPSPDAENREIPRSINSVEAINIART